MIGIRVDANGRIASGHVMRCLSIAIQLKKMGQSVLFITADAYPKEIIESRGFSSEILGSAFDTVESEIEKLRNCCEKYCINTLLVDSYYVTAGYFEQLKDVVKVMYLDDMIAFAYPVKALVNYSLCDTHTSYEQLYLQKELPELLLGEAYVPLREEFTCGIRETKPQITDVLVTSGATDLLDVVKEFISLAVEENYFSQVNFHVISGAFNKNVQVLRQYSASHSNIKIYENVTNIADIMKMCDIAISAGGTTLLELCAMGIPTIAYIVAENQKKGTEALESLDTILYAGDARDGKEQLLEKIGQKIRLLQTDYNMRCAMHKKASQLIDGKGAIRIANKLIEISKN